MIPVRRLGYMTLQTADIPRLVAHYTELLGLFVVHRDSRNVVLATHLGREAMVFTSGDTGTASLAFQVAPDFDLARGETELCQLGLQVQRRSDPLPGIPESIVFSDPNGTQIELFRTSSVAEGGEPCGMGVLKLGHVAHTTPQIHTAVDFYTRVLGFRVSDWMADFFAFLRCGPDHHTVNLLTRPTTRLHHIAFELRDWAHVQSACELLGRKRIPIIWGPGRHGIGHNIFVNYRDPDDHIIELYTELDVMADEALGWFEPRPWHRDRPQIPKIWDPDDAALIWGTPPTAEFLRERPPGA
jgi:catechol 2,3-dioxygenase-like lactoylglutathione lyase family enzyme